MNKIFFETFNYLNENIFFSGDDIVYKFDEWEKSKDGKLFIAGYTGSGKSTLVKDLVKKYNVKVVEMDHIKKDKEYIEKLRKENTKESYKELQDYYKEIVDKNISNALNGKEKLIIEGIQVIYYTYPEQFKDHSIIFKGTSALISFIRAFKRNRKDDWAKDMSYKDIMIDIYHNLSIERTENFIKLVKGWIKKEDN